MENSNNKMSIVGAIILAGLLIAGAIIYSNKPSGNTQTAGPTPDKIVQTPEQNLDQITAIQASDHLLGNPEAPVTVITYSDIDCPFCKQFHQTMTQIMDEYGKDGKVKWIYRQLPLEMLHPNAKREAQATECANELAGNEKFWQYLDALVANVTPFTQANLDKELAKMAKDLGIDETKFIQCLTDNKYASLIDKDIQNAVSAGIQGTPFSVILSGKGQSIIPGALPHSDIKQKIDALLP